MTIFFHGIEPPLKCGGPIPDPFSIRGGVKKEKRKTHFQRKRFDHALNIRLYTSRNVNATAYVERLVTYP
jgi:hypothetical protein